MKPVARAYRVAPLLLATFAAGASLPAEQPFDYLRNSWSLIGLKDCRSGTLVTPDNRLILGGGRQAVIRCGKELSPLERRVKTLENGWLPIVHVAASDGPIR